MNGLLSVWTALEPRRRIIVVLATAAMFVAVLLLARAASAPQMALLYAGLDPARSGEVVAALEQRGAVHEVRGQAIFVDAAQRDGLRMALAAEGLPAQGGAGYELLDGLTGFGTTAQMFDAAWGRAVEGELARTILANPAFRAARVHIARADPQPFGAKGETTASVVVTSLAGATSEAEARALRHLVAAAVPGLRTTGVEVIDSVGGLVGDEATDASAKAADSRAEAVRQNVERLLAARVGPGKAVVQVAIELETRSEQLTERIIDPQARVALKTESESKSGSDSTAGGAVTVASNLPQGTGGDSGKSESAETTERVTYDVSETNRAVTHAPGDIRRLTVAVLIDGTRIKAENGNESWQPRSDDEMAALRDLVAAAVGFDEKRGDVLTLKSLEFLPAPEPGTLAEAGGGVLSGSLDRMALVELAVLALVAAGIGLFVLRPALAGRRAEPLALPEAAPDALSGEIAPVDAMGDFPIIDLSPAEADPVSRLRRLIEERQAESVEILRGWMEAETEKT